MAMDMEGVRSYTFAAALLFLTLVVLAAAASSGGGGDDAAAVEDKQCHPRADEPYMLVAFHNKDGEETRLLADQRNELASGVSAFTNRSGNAGIREGEGKRRRRLPLPKSKDNRSRGEGLWNTLGVLVNSTAASDSDPAAADDEQGYMLVGMQTGGGDKIRLVVVVVADQRYFFIAGFAQGFFRPPNWFFREGERHRLLPSLGNGGSHAEVVASNVLAAMMKDGSSCC